ncbi:hypothetical protein A0J61_11556, partial [Choanephora cucurbitarum]
PANITTSLPTFMGIFSFFGDELHMIGHGLGHLVYNLLDPKANGHLKVKSSLECSFDFDQPGYFQDLIDWIAFSSLRAVDSQFFLLHIVPTMIIPRLKYPSSKKALINLVNACSISLQRLITEGELEDMKRFFTIWAIFLKAEIADRRLMRYGPLRYYSCRSLERTVQKYTNLSRSRSAPDVETNNLLKRFSHFKPYNSYLNLRDLITARRKRADEYEDHLDDVEGVMPQLWEKFEKAVLIDDLEIASVSMVRIRQAMERYLTGLHSGPSSLDNSEVKWAARAVIDGVVIQSR